MKAIGSMIHGEQNKIQTGLICRLYLAKDKSKSVTIQVYKNTTVKELFQKFKVIIEGNIAKFDEETQEYKFILKDISNEYSEFILKDNFLLFDYLMNDKYELYYLPLFKKKTYTIPMALKDKNSFQHIDPSQNINIKTIKEQLVKEGTCFKFSKKLNQFVKANIYLHSDILEIEKIKSKKGSMIIPLTSVSEIKKVYDKSYKQGYSTLLISSVYSSRTKVYYIAFDNDSFESWFSSINDNLHQYLDSFSFSKICQDLNDLNKKKNSFIIQLVNKFNNIKSLLSINFCKKIFYDFYDNENIKQIYDLIIEFQEKNRKKDFLGAKENLEQIINIFEQNKEIKLGENKNVLEFLKQYYEKLKEINEIIKEKDDDLIKKDGYFYDIIDNLIKKYFEPKFNEIINSQDKSVFFNRILEYCIQKQNKKDNEFYDIDSCINELILVN